MGYTVEVSFDVRTRGNITEVKRELRNIADNCNCEGMYFMHEIEGKGRNIQRNHCVFVVNFDLNQIMDIIYFLTKMRQDSYIYIECMYQDDSICNLIHASPKYLQRMEKNFVKQYKKERKTHIYTQIEENFISTIRGKPIQNN